MRHRQGNRDTQPQPGRTTSRSRTTTSQTPRMAAPVRVHERYFREPLIERVRGAPAGCLGVEK
jgi:hypothetical protein